MVFLNHSFTKEESPARGWHQKSPKDNERFLACKISLFTYCMQFCAGASYYPWALDTGITWFWFNTRDECTWKVGPLQLPTLNNKGVRSVIVYKRSTPQKRQFAMCDFHNMYITLCTLSFWPMTLNERLKKNLSKRNFNSAHLQRNISHWLECLC